MNLLIIIPRQPRTTGNHVSAHRFAQSLAALGWQTRILAVGESDVEPIRLALQQPTDVVLLLHAYRSGRPWLLSGPPLGLPSVVLLTGTDFNRDLKVPESGQIIQRVLAGAAAILVQNRLTFADIKSSDLSWRSKVQLLPPGILLGSDTFPLRGKLGLNAEDFLLLHPASLRPVKGNFELFSMARVLLKRHPQLQLVFCGPSIDKDYAAQLMRVLQTQQRASYVGEIPCGAMADVMRQADLVLNNSLSEGLPNALVEAASLGRPVLAHNIPGNRTVIQHGVNGLLFDGAQDFQTHLTHIMEDASLRQALSHAAGESFSAELEGERLALIIAEVLAQGRITA